ncbi:MAG: hypothetical protein HYZ75_06520 [Elusimicrobia bacterium]|nr:hypothetical protein [Elusimicrobiota bacterium]
MGPAEMAFYGLAAVVTVAAVLASLREGSRRPTTASRKTAAQALGLRYLEELTSDPPTRDFIPVLWFAEDLPRRYHFRNVMFGESGARNTWLFDLEVYEARSRHGDILLTTQTVALFNIPGAALPIFKVIAGKVAAKKSVDIVLPFLETHTLIAEDKAAAASLFLNAGPGFLSGETGWSIEGGGQWLALWRPGAILPSDQLKAFLERADALRAQLA